MNLNKAIIAGRLTQDPQSRNLPSGQSVVSFSIATNRIWVDQSGNKQEATDFHNIVTFGKLADICSRYLTKGQLILIEGRIQTRSWEDQNGVKRQRTEIIANNMQMGPRSASSTNGQPAKPFSQDNSTSQDEIPVIESEEPISQENNEPDSQEDKSKNAEKVDINDIPF